ncbi:MAG: ComF family protein [Phycisphaerales bacterium JB040]
MDNARPEAESRFRWPPRSPGDAPPASVLEPKPAPTVVPARARLLESFEEAWIGVRSRSFRRRAELEGWSPAAVETRCWRCGTGIGAHESDGDGCASCRDATLPWGRCVCLGDDEGVLGDAVRDVKFAGWRLVGTQLGRALGERLREAFERYEIPPSGVAIVPVPTSRRHRVSRGIDHTLVIARGVASASGARVVRGLSRRHGPSQTSVPRSQRALNVRGVFRRRGDAAVLGEARLVVLVDDIRTTGATLIEAARTVRGVRRASQRGHVPVERVWAAPVAVVPDPRRRGVPGVAEGVSGESGGAGSPDAGRQS